MSSKSLARRMSPVAAAVLLAACGGGGGGGGAVDSAGTPQIGGAGGTDGGVAPTPVASGEPLTGRVADGYIRGAVVCVDLNENEACDAEEPSTVTGTGGVYRLDLPVGAGDKPIVADIPAEAVDEDTGEAIGKKLVFIAPAEKPEFLSPITTLVQQELKANPALDVDEAEASVKSVLGIDEEEVSLFVDYVAESEDRSNGTEITERFRYLHDTARVVASMMKDIETQVEDAASAKGIDVAGDADTRRAIREIVRDEVRELLPQIARQVAQLVSEADTDGTDAEPDADAFDPDRIATELRPSDAAADVESRIEAVRESVDAEPTDMRSLLGDGMYWMDFDCGFDGPPPHETQPNGGEPMVDFDGDGAPDAELDPYPQFPYPVCRARYGHVQLDASGTELLATEYELDPESGGWTLVDETDAGNDGHGTDYVLVDGEWVGATVDGGPEGTITFADDGSAVLENGSESMRIKAAKLPLDGYPLLHHVWDHFADPIWFELAGDDDLFATGAAAYALSLRRESHPYVLFNHAPWDEQEQSRCADYGDNCNIVALDADGQSFAATSLDAVRESALAGVKLLPGGADFAHGMKMKLFADATDGALPTEGTVAWPMDFGEPTPGAGEEHPYPGEGQDPYGTFPEGEVPEECLVGSLPTDGEPLPGGFPEGQYSHGELPEGQDPHGFLPEGQDSYGGLPEGQDPYGELPEGQDPYGEFPEGQDPYGELPGGEYPPGTFPECPDLAALGGEAPEEPPLGYPDDHPDGEHADVYAQSDATLSSRWRLIEVDGVPMIEIELPFLLRHGEETEGEEAMLLIEHEGFVRMGARLPQSMIERELTYNEAALATLRALVERAAQADPR